MSENKDGAQAPQIRTVADMMKALEDEAGAIKRGEISLDVARVLARYRGLEIQTAQLLIQYQRVNRQQGRRTGATTYDITTGKEVAALTEGRPAGVPEPGPAPAQPQAAPEKTGTG